MARSHARILTSIWADPDFLALTADAQRVYIVALSQPQVSFCGVVAFTERRWASLAADTNPDRIRDALAELEACRFVMTDHHTDEVFIRSFVANDAGLLSTPNVLRAMVTDYSSILSPRLRKAFLWEWHSKLARRVDPGEKASTKQWQRGLAAIATLPEKPSNDPWDTPKIECLGDPRGEGLAEGRREGPTRARSPQHQSHTQPTPNATLTETLDAAPAEPPAASGGTATPQPQPPAVRVLERIAGQAPPDVTPKLQAGVNGDHTRLINQALARGWSTHALADTIGQRGWTGVTNPPKALLARLQRVGDPPNNTPPAFDRDALVADDPGHDVATRRTELNRIRELLAAEKDD